MLGKIKEEIEALLAEQKKQGLFKQERIIETAQGSNIAIAGEKTVLNFCSNNYLGFANHQTIIQAAKDAMDRWGYGLSSVRFICGTQGIHKTLEKKISTFLGTEDTLLYAACFDANAGVFEPLLGEQDAIISDALNHASLIDGIRLCKARRLRYRHADMGHLEESLEEAASARYRVICTDGIFSMDGDMAPLDSICELAERYEALVVVDDSHATGYIGPTGRGTPEHFGVTDRVDLITTTFGKALGGASGGCTSGSQQLIEMLRQRSRPYLFSNTLAPAVAGATLAALELVDLSADLRKKLQVNADYFRTSMQDSGFDIISGKTAIVPVMIYDEPKAIEMADRLLDEGIYVVGLVYPVVPKGRARIRVQLSATHSRDNLEQAVKGFQKTGRELGLVD